LNSFILKKVWRSEAAKKILNTRSRSEHEDKKVKAHLQVENKPGFCQKPGLYTRD
jgi:hypothetical protein